ncbi:hypothetical protein F5Y03DRAFT_371762 [Xylaria venustula]|nr:hypothetical protein F5Y03DRAFT_371762 [Xylaria venustula]
MTILGSRSGSNIYKNRCPKHAACTECRASKVKCDGQRPSCGKCASHSKGCTYVDGRRKRNSQNRSPPAGKAPSSQVEDGDGGGQIEQLPLPTIDTSQEQSADSATQHSPMDWVDDIIPLDTTVPLEEVPGLDPLQRNEIALALDTEMTFDPGTFGAFDLTVEPNSMDRITLPASPLEALGSDDLGFHVSEQYPFVPTVTPPPSLDITDLVMAQAQALPSGKIKTGQSRCPCLEDLASGLITCDLWEAAEGDETVEAADLTDIVQIFNLKILAYLSLFHNWTKIWNRARSCQAYCVARHEYALLFILNLNRVIKLQMHLIIELSAREPDHPSQLAELYRAGDNQESILSAMGNDEAQCSFLLENTAIGAGLLPFDGVFGHSSMIKGLIRSRIGRLQASIHFLRGVWIAAGLNDCSAKLDLASSALDDHVVLLYEKPSG